MSWLEEAEIQAQPSDCEWVAAELEQQVLQDLYAVGVSLNTTLARSPGGADLRRLQREISSLDAAVRRIYTIVLTLREQPTD